MPNDFDYLFRGRLRANDPELADLIDYEAQRQARKLIMIPSESHASIAVREAVGSVFSNLYAEGYPDEGSRRLTQEQILDYEGHLGYNRRYSDLRYYQGVEYANILEALARRRGAEAFATPDVPPDDIFVNVQALSGAAANTAVQMALLQPGDTILSMALNVGGHLSHGSPVAWSGKTFKVVHYSVDPVTERLDYDAIMALARQHKPKLVIAGFTSYPWAPDWARFRQIADAVGAYLLADIAHVAGLVAAGAYPTPVGYADAVTFTTHKSLMGPRGACILTTRRDLSPKIDRGVFPGLQGGPHANKWAGMAVAFRMATTNRYRDLQYQVVANAGALARALQAHGMRLPYGGTDTHLLLVDCKTACSEGGVPLMGDVAARILDIVGIVCNRNTIPGDETAAYPSGIRLGTPWVTQRGLREPEMQAIADLIARTFQGCTPYVYTGSKGPVYRARIDFDLLEQLKLDLRALTDRAGLDYTPTCYGYPHFYFIDDQPLGTTGFELIQVKGSRSGSFIELLSPTPLTEKTPGRPQPFVLLEQDGRLMSPASLNRGTECDCWYLTVPQARASRVLTWLRALADGYVSIDGSDPHAKLPPLHAVNDLGSAAPVELPEVHTAPDGRAVIYSEEPFYVGLTAVADLEPRGEPLPPFEWQPPDPVAVKPRRTPLYEEHKAFKAKMVPFGGWEMPVWYEGVSEEHAAVRKAAGLFDVAHMGVFEASGPDAARFLDLLVTNDVLALEPGQSQYAALLAPDGATLDDLMIYLPEPGRYVVVVNAANNDKDWAWMNGVLRGELCIDEARPWARGHFDAVLRDLRDPASGDDRRVDLALQGPRSRDILLALGGDETDLERIRDLPWAGVARVTLGGFDLIVSRTGYTGERVAFELFVHPERAAELWQRLLELGSPLGLKPCGLAARDSLRNEAGLPLYGHELDGPLGLNPADAGFGSYVKTYKPFFVGRKAYLAHEAGRDAVVVRFRVREKGGRLPKLEDRVTDTRGRVIGAVTSCTLDSEGYLIGQAYLLSHHAEIGTRINIFPRPSSRESWDKPFDTLEVGDRLVLHSEATILRRFPKK